MSPYADARTLDLDEIRDYMRDWEMTKGRPWTRREARFTPQQIVRLKNLGVIEIAGKNARGQSLYRLCRGR